MVTALLSLFIGLPTISTVINTVTISHCDFNRNYNDLTGKSFSYWDEPVLPGTLLGYCAVRD